jgi:hypothetical protein
VTVRGTKDIFDAVMDLDLWLEIFMLQVRGLLKATAA